MHMGGIVSLRNAGLQIALLASGLASIGTAPAVELAITLEAGGEGVGNAVVSLHSPEAEAALVPGQADLDQRDGQFDPRVLAITRGTTVGFPNSDKVRHHVYSFSPVKRFELPLFSGRAGTPVTFDRAGVATLGCNIHDWMVAHVVVLDTPYFARSDAAGRAVLDAPPGTYSLRVWHERLAPGTPVGRELVLDERGRAESITLELAAPAPPRASDRRLRRPAGQDPGR
jgi:plastocyanin